MTELTANGLIIEGPLCTEEDVDSMADNDATDSDQLEDEFRLGTIDEE